jgi:retron-type reverse transcriptase
MSGTVQWNKNFSSKAKIKKIPQEKQINKFDFVDSEVKDIYADIICQKNLLAKYYYEISKNKSAKDNETLDSYSKETLESLHESLRNHSFKFKPIRQVNIPKSNGRSAPLGGTEGEWTRTLGIPGPRDKIVHRTMVHALNHVYEKQFLDCSHGFRPGKSEHSALKQITGWAGTKWFIEGDLSKCLDSINYHTLAELLQNRVNSKQFIDLYWKAVRARYINFAANTKEQSFSGIMQGNAVSLILVNIYLNELDVLMHEKAESSKISGKTTEPNPEYKRIHTKISNLRQAFNSNLRRTPLDGLEKKARLEMILKLEKERAKLPSTIPSKGFRIYYTRYANNFLIGVTGPKRLAEELKEEISKFINKKLKLELSSEKMVITRSDHGSYFLGAIVKRMTSRTNDQPRRKNSTTEIGRKVRARIPQGGIRAMVPLEKVVKKLQSQGICRIINFSQRDVIPTRKTAWVNLELAEIVTKYNKLWIGLLNYYSFAYNRSQLNFVQYLLQHSLACTIMNKLKLNSRRQVFKKFSKEIKINNNGKKGKFIKFKLQKSLKRINKFSNNNLSDPFAVFKHAIRTKGNLLDARTILRKRISGEYDDPSIY